MVVDMFSNEGRVASAVASALLTILGVANVSVARILYLARPPRLLRPPGPNAPVLSRHDRFRGQCDLWIQSLPGSFVVASCLSVGNLAYGVGSLIPAAREQLVGGSVASLVLMWLFGLMPLFISMHLVVVRWHAAAQQQGVPLTGGSNLARHASNWRYLRLTVAWLLASLLLACIGTIYMLEAGLFFGVASLVVYIATLLAWMSFTSYKLGDRVASLAADLRRAQEAAAATAKGVEAEIEAETSQTFLMPLTPRMHSSPQVVTDAELEFTAGAFDEMLSLPTVFQSPISSPVRSPGSVLRLNSASPRHTTGNFSVRRRHGQLPTHREGETVETGASEETTLQHPHLSSRNNRAPARRVVSEPLPTSNVHSSTGTASSSAYRVAPHALWTTLQRRQQRTRVIGRAVTCPVAPDGDGLASNDSSEQFEGTPTRQHPESAGTPNVPPAGSSVTPSRYAPAHHKAVDRFFSAPTNLNSPIRVHPPSNSPVERFSPTTGLSPRNLFAEESSPRRTGGRYARVLRPFPTQAGFSPAEDAKSAEHTTTGTGSGLVQSARVARAARCSARVKLLQKHYRAVQRHYRWVLLLSNGIRAGGIALLVCLVFYILVERNTGTPRSWWSFGIRLSVLVIATLLTVSIWPDRTRRSRARIMPQLRRHILAGR